MIEGRVSFSANNLFCSQHGFNVQEILLLILTLNDLLIFKLLLVEIVTSYCNMHTPETSTSRVTRFSQQSIAMWVTVIDLIIDKNFVKAECKHCRAYTSITDYKPTIMSTTLTLTVFDQKEIMSGLFHSAMLNTLLLGIFDSSMLDFTS